MPKFETLQKGFIDDPDNQPDARITMAKVLVKTITFMYPDMDYYIGVITVDTKEYKRFLEYCPPSQDITEFVFESLLDPEHRPPSSKKIDQRFDYYKRKYGMSQFVTVYRAESDHELKVAEKKIVDSFFNKEERCKNRAPGGSVGIETPFHHGYVYLAYSGKPVNPRWLGDVVSAIATRHRSRSMEYENRRRSETDSQDSQASTSSTGPSDRSSRYRSHRYREMQVREENYRRRLTRTLKELRTAGVL